MERLPGDPEKSNFTRAVAGAAYSEVLPTPVRAPRLLAFSERLGQELGIARPGARELELLAGNFRMTGMKPYAARYGGHQFGQWAGQLGDGRAITLGEIRVASGGGERSYELQLKGAGPTPYSRRADGRAVLRSSVREFLCSEAMHHLGVPTTRALSLVGTGEDVTRDMFYDGNPKPEPGAIVCRVSPTFLRFGNFEILAAQGEEALLASLARVLIHDHFPALDPAEPGVFALLLDEVARRTARMVAEWMRVGFVHGVMNTDNMSMLGLTIDYGPYGWLEPYDPDWTPNTTDAQGRRYRFGNQPAIASWNLARLCEAFYPLVRDEARLHASLALYKDNFESASKTMLARKFGFDTVEPARAAQLVAEAFELMGAAETDFTLFFRSLSGWQNEEGQAFLELISPAFYSVDLLSGELRERWAAWSVRYAEQLRLEGENVADRAQARRERMKRANPKYVLRNYLAQNAIQAAAAGDLSGIERLMRVLENPCDDQPAEEELAARRPDWARDAPGCSALSCSS